MPKPTPVFDNLDRLRAAAVSRLAASALTTGDEPLIVDLKQPGGALQGKHWIFEHLVLIANLTTRSPIVSGAGPITGLFLCPPATPTETIAEAIAGWSLDARPLPVPACCSMAALGTGQFALSIIMSPGFKMTCPSGWFMRAIVTCQAGTATPGPGVGSEGRLTALVMEEYDAYDLCAPAPGGVS